MTTYATTTDIAASWFLIAAALIVLGVTFIGVVRSAWIEARDERTAKRAERIVSESPEDRSNRLARMLADNEIEVMARVVGLVDNRPSAPVIPLQRRGE